MFLFLLIFASCSLGSGSNSEGEATFSQTGIGAISGGVLGAGVGAIIGSSTGNAGEGLAIGSVIGTALGAGIGNHLGEQEKKAQALEKTIDQNALQISAQKQQLEELKSLSRDTKVRNGNRKNDSLPADGGYARFRYNDEENKSKISSQSTILKPPSSKTSRMGVPNSISSDDSYRINTANSNRNSNSNTYKENSRRVNTDLPPANVADANSFNSNLDSVDLETTATKSTTSNISKNVTKKSLPVRSASMNADEKKAFLSKHSSVKSTTKKSSQNLKSTKQTTKKASSSVEKEAETSLVDPSTEEKLKKELEGSKNSNDTEIENSENLKVIDKKVETVEADAEKDSVEKKSPEKIGTEFLSPENPDGGTKLAKTSKSGVQKKPTKVPSLDSSCSRAQVEAETADKSNSDADRLFYLRRAIKLCPNNPGFHNSAANIYKKIGRIEDAQFEYQKALELDPSNSEAKSGLSDTKNEY